VELHDKADRLGDKLRWYRDAARYAEVLWLTRRDGVRRPLEQAIAEAGCAELMWGETLPDECLAYVR
jgi:isocitrate lyase